LNCWHFPVREIRKGQIAAIDIEDLHEEEIKGSWSIWKGMVITDEFLPEASFLYTAVVQSLDGTEIKLPKKFDANVVSQFIS